MQASVTVESVIQFLNHFEEVGYEGGFQHAPGHDR